MDEPRRPRFFTVGRLLDAVALLVIAFVVWKIFIAPRAFKRPDAYPAPRVVYQRLDGGTFTVADARGKVLFLDFYASWCEPCKLETPLIERFARRHPNVIVMPVDVGEPPALAARFARAFKLGNVALDPKSLSQGYFQVQGFPTVVVIDPRGDIRATWSGFNPAIDLALGNAERKLQ